MEVGEENWNWWFPPLYTEKDRGTCGGQCTHTLNSLQEKWVSAISAPKCLYTGQTTAAEFHSISVTSRHPLPGASEANRRLAIGDIRACGPDVSESWHVGA